MSRSRSTGLAVAFVLLGAIRAHALEHLRVSSSDAFLLCARALFGKPVFRGAEVFRGHRMEIDIPCPSTRDELARELEGSGTYLEPEKIKIVELPGAVFLYPSRLLYKRDAWVQWKRLEVPITVRSWDSVPGSRNLSAAEQEAVREVVLREARTVPLVTPSVPGKDGETATIEVTLWLDAHRLAPASPESVVAIFGQSGGALRLIYGEMREGKYEILWDSPLFRTGVLSFGIGYEDMDGDGSADILVSGDVGLGGHTSLRLLVWDKKGHELTRQSPCRTDDSFAITEEGGACPIAAASIELDDPQKDGKRDILVKGRVQDSVEVDREQVFRYHLVNGRYVVEQTVTKKPTKRASPLCCG